MTTLEKVIEVVANETGAAPVYANTRLDSLGLDSLEFVCLMQAIQSAIADIPDAEWASMDTIDDIAKACERHL